MVARQTRTLAIAVLTFACVAGSAVQSAFATPNDCNDMSTLSSKVISELDKKDSDPSSANSSIGAFSNEAKLCVDDNDGDNVPDALEKVEEGAKKSTKELFDDWEKKVKNWRARA